MINHWISRGVTRFIHSCWPKEKVCYKHIRDNTLSHIIDEFASNTASCPPEWTLHSSKYTCTRLMILSVGHFLKFCCNRINHRQPPRSAWLTTTSIVFLAARFAYWLGLSQRLHMPLILGLRLQRQYLRNVLPTTTEGRSSREVSRNMQSFLTVSAWLAHNHVSSRSIDQTGPSGIMGQGEKEYVLLMSIIYRCHIIWNLLLYRWYFYWLSTCLWSTSSLQELVAILSWAQYIYYITASSPQTSEGATHSHCTDE